MARITKAKQLTERDRSILTDITRCRAVSFEQIKATYWPEAKERTCQERLMRLEKAGYIKVTTVPAEKPGAFMEIYSLTTKGKNWAAGPEGPGIDRKMIFSNPGKENEIIHQIRTNQVYFTLSDSEKSTWIIGDALEIKHNSHKGNKEEFPDASYSSDSDGEEVFVETDCGKYNAKQIRQKVAAFTGKKTIWVCPDGREKTLIRHGAKGDFFRYKIKQGSD